MPACGATMKAYLNMDLWHKLVLLKHSLLLVILSSQNAILSAVSEIDTAAELLAADRDELDRVFLADLLGETAALTTDSGSVTTTALTPPVAAASMLVQIQSPKPRPHVCSDCGATFAQRSHLTRHLRTHTGEKPYACLDCGAAFVRHSDLACNLRTHTGEKPYACSGCGAAFAQRGDLTRHLRTHTGEKPYGCSECGVVFTDRSNLNKHMR